MLIDLSKKGTASHHFHLACSCFFGHNDHLAAGRFMLR